MGNCNCKSRGQSPDEEYFQHEMLPEDDNNVATDEYFAKIEKRNATFSRDTSIPPPNQMNKRKSKKGKYKASKLLLSSASSSVSNSTTPTASAGITPSHNGSNVSAGGISPIGVDVVGGNNQYRTSAVRNRTAMLEQAEADAMMRPSSRGHHPGASAAIITTGRARFNLVISPTASSGADSTGGGATSPLSPLSGRSGGSGAIPPALPASRKDTTSSATGRSSSSAAHRPSSPRREVARNRGGAPSASASALASSRGGYHNRSASNTTTSDVILDYIAEGGSAHDYDEDSSRPGINGSSSVRLMAFEASLSDALTYAEIVRADRVSAVAWEPGLISTRDDHLVAVGTDDGLVAILDAEEQHQIETSKGRIAKDLGGGIRRLFRTPSGRVKEMPAREGKIRSLSWSPTTPNHLCVGGDDCTATIVDVRTFAVVAELEREDRVYEARYSPDGRYVAVGGYDGMVAIAQSDTMALVTEISRSGLVHTLSWNHDGSLLAIGGSDKQATVVETEGWAVVGEVQRPASVHCVRWHPLNPERCMGEYGQLLAVGGNDGVVAIVDIDGRRVVKDVALPDPPSSGTAAPQDRIGGQHQDRRVNDVVWSPDGAFLAVGGSNGAVVIVETRSFVVVQEIPRAVNVTCMDWQSDGHFLAVGGEDKAAAILKTGGMMGVPSSSPGEATDRTDGAGDVGASPHSRTDTGTGTSGAKSDSGPQAPVMEWTLSEDFEDVEDEGENVNLSGITYGETGAVIGAIGTSTAVGI